MLRVVSKRLFSTRLSCLSVFAFCWGLSVGARPLLAEISLTHDAEKCSDELAEVEKKTAVLKGLRALLAYNRTCAPEDRISLNFNQLKRDKSDRTAKVLKDAGVNIPTGAILHRRALTLFQNSWDLALQQAGEDPATIRKETKVLTAKNLLKVLKHLDTAGVDLQSNNFRQDQSTQTKQQILKALGENFSPWTIHEVARKNYDGDWYASLKAAGVDPEKHRSNYNIVRAVNSDNVGPLLRALDAAGVDLGARAFEEDVSDGTARTIENILGKKIKPASIYAYVREMYSGDWYSALTAANVDVNKHLPEHTKAITRSNVGPLLRALDAAGLDLGSRAFSADRSDKTLKIIQASLGQRVLPTTIVYSVRAMYAGDWYAGLEANQIDSKKHLPEFVRTVTTVNAGPLLRALDAAGVDLSSDAFANDKSEATLDLIETHLGKRVTSETVVRSVRDLYGSWYSGLETNQVDAKKYQTVYVRAVTATNVGPLLRALDEAGVDLSQQAFSKGRSAKTLEIIEAVLGKRVSPVTVILEVRDMYLGGWYAALDANQVDASKHRRYHRWTRDDFIKVGEILSRAKNGQEAQQLVSDALGKSISHSSMWGAANRSIYAKDLEELVEYTELRSKLVRMTWTKTKIKNALKGLYDAGFLPSSGFLQNRKGILSIEIDTMKILRAATHRRTSMKSLVSGVTALYGGDLDAALRDAGLDPDTIRQREKKFLWKEEPLAIPLALLALDESGIPPSYSVLQTENPEYQNMIANILEEALGQRINPASLLRAIQVNYPGGLLAAQLQAGLDPAQVNRMSVIDWKSKIPNLKIIALQLKEMGYVPSIELFTTSDPSIRADVQGILQENLGSEIYPLDYVRAVNRFYEANLSDNPNKWTVRVRTGRTNGGGKPGYPWEENRDKFLATLRALDSAGLPPHSVNFSSHDFDIRTRMTSIIKEHMGQEFSPATFYHAVYLHYDSTLLGMLREAGLDPAEILIHFPAYFRLSHLPTQVEYGRSSEPGEISGGRLVGATREQNPAQALSDAESNSRMTSALSSIYEANHSMLSLVLRIVADMPEEDIQIPAIVDRIRTRYGQSVEIEDVERLFSTIRDNPVLSEITP